jgi:hypothetical protein
VAPLTDPEMLGHYRMVLGLWRFTGYVNWTDTAAEWVQKNLGGVTPAELLRIMCEHVEGGGEIDRVAETRSEWSEHRWHYDIRLNVPGRPIYIETRLIVGPTPEDSTILVVNVNET